MSYRPPKGSSERVPERESLTFLVRKDVKKHLEAGKRFFDQGLIERAIERYQQALAADPSCALIHFNLGFAYHEEGNISEARRNYERAIDLEPNCSLFLEHLARLHFELEEYHQSIDLFLSASLVGQMLPISSGLLGRAYFEIGQYHDALDALRQMVDGESNPGLVCVAKSYMVRCLLELGRLYEARQLARQVLRNEDAEVRVLMDLGEAFLRARVIDLSREFFEKVILRREEALAARRRIEEIQKIDHQIDEFLPQLYQADEEKLLRFINVLMKVGSTRVSQKLISGFRNSVSPMVREAVIEYHRRYGLEEFEMLGGAESDPVNFVREKYVEYVSDSRYPDKKRFMERCLSSESERVRLLAARYFEDTGSMDLLPALETVCSAEPSEDVRAALRTTIAKVKRRGQETIAEMYAETPTRALETASARLSWRPLLLYGAGVLLTIYLVIHLVLKGIGAF